jgi:choice-of-anchor B domain-containing protein
MIRLLIPSAPALALVLAAVSASTVSAHEDDGKIRDRQKPFRGPAWFEGKSGNGGVAGGGFESQGIQLKSWLPLNTLSPGAQNGNSCWGWVSPAGREYAIIGLYDGTAFVDVTNPSAATLKSFQPGPASLWRDVRTHLNYCYAASEGGSGVQVFDMAALDTAGTTTLVNTITAPTTTTAATHTLAVDNVSGFLYRAGGGSNGMRFYDLNANPANPTYVGAWSPIYVHEAEVRTFTSGPYAGKQIAFCYGGGNGGFANTGLYIVDVTNKANPVQLSYTTYPNARFCHQGWLDEQGQYVYINDELDEGDTVSVTTTIVMDVSNLAAPVVVGTFTNGNTAVGHNIYVKGDLVYEANYRSGLRIFNLAASRTNPPEVAWFDTYPGSDSANFNGLWNVWPYFPSGTIIGSDIERGLFVWRLGTPVASIALLSQPPALVNPAGGTTVDVSIVPGQGQTLDLSTAVMKVSVGTGTVTTPLSPLSGNTFRATFPPTQCAQNVSYQFEVRNTAGDVTFDVARTTFSAAGIATLVDDRFEAASGWTAGIAGDTATSGQWVRVDPNGTSAQPEDDHTAKGTQCFVTGQGTPGGAAGAADVDGGVTTLVSPNYDLTGLDEPTLEYWYLYSNNLGGSPNSDSMPVEISNNGGTTWLPLETISASSNAWVKRTWRVRDFITPTSQVRVRFIARDLGQGSLVEAAIDDLRITNVDCTADIVGDVNGDGVVNGTDLGLLLGAWGTGNAAADLNDDGVVNATDLALLVGAWQ